jgi:branched-chain amino acid transport system ATP-binding protein
MLELNSVRAGYGRLPVLFDVSLQVSAGEMVAVLGANGAGKSTLLKTIFGLVSTRSGTIRFRGQRIGHAPAHARFAAGISLSPEGRRIFANLSVRDNLLAGAYGLASDVVERQMETCFALFPRLEDRRRQTGGSLSGGEQQMLAISRALMSRPRLLLVDELSLGLAPLVVRNLLTSLRELCDQGLSVVVVDQFASTLAGFAERGYVLEKGCVVDAGSVADLAAALATDEIGEAMLATGAREGGPR